MNKGKPVKKIIKGEFPLYVISHEELLLLQRSFDVVSLPLIWHLRGLRQEILDVVFGEVYW